MELALCAPESVGRLVLGGRWGEPAAVGAVARGNDEWWLMAPSANAFCVKWAINLKING